jgi:hypothetical protein
MTPNEERDERKARYALAKAQRERLEEQAWLDAKAAKSASVVVTKVDDQGRPAAGEGLIPGTNWPHPVRFEGGYQRPGAVTDYNPIQKFEDEVKR